MTTAPETYPRIFLYKRIVQAKLFIDNHFGDNIDINNIAEEAYFSKFHFIRLFKKIFGKTPHQYLTTVRIEKAKQLLREETPVTVVCFAVGFESASSFSGLFKRMVGMSPSAYLFQYQKINAHIKETPLDFVPHCFAEKNGWIKNSNFEEVGD